MARVVQYRSVADAIVNEVRRDKHGPGYKLPQVRELARRHGVSVFTAAKALEFLEKRGVVERKWAVGCFLTNAATGRKANRPYTIGILLDPMKVPTDGWNHEMLQSLLDTIQRSGAKPTYVSWREGLELGLDVDGLLVTSSVVSDSSDPTQADSIRKWLKSTAQGRVPIVSLDFEMAGVHSVMIDNVGGMEQVARYLIHLGHKDIAYLHVPNSWSNSEERLAGLRKALTAAGLSHSDDLVWTCRPSPKTARALFPEFYKKHKFTAICCFEDLSASGVVKAAMEMGLRVPGDLSVCGFGNAAIDDISIRSLTTTDVSIRQMTAAVVSTLVEKIESGDTEASKTRIPSQLIVRETTGPIAK